MRNTGMTLHWSSTTHGEPVSGFTPINAHPSVSIVYTYMYIHVLWNIHIPLSSFLSPSSILPLSSSPLPPPSLLLRPSSSLLPLPSLLSRPSLSLLPPLSLFSRPSSSLLSRPSSYLLLSSLVPPPTSLSPLLSLLPPPSSLSQDPPQE